MLFQNLPILSPSLNLGRGKDFVMASTHRVRWKGWRLGDQGGWVIKVIYFDLALSLWTFGFKTQPPCCGTANTRVSSQLTACPNLPATQVCHLRGGPSSSSWSLRMWGLPSLTRIGFVSKSNACCCFPPVAELEVVGHTALAHTRCPQILANDRL